MLRFNDSWLELPQFSDWLVRVTNDDTRAYCRCCAIVLRAHRTDLMTHSTTQRHVKNANSGAGAQTGPISVQILSNDSEGGSQKDEDSPSKKSPYAKRYRKEWEELPELKNWLMQHTEDPSKAYCRVCEVTLRSHKHDLMIHAKSLKHKKMEETYVGEDNDNVGNMDFITGSFVEENEDDSVSNPLENGDGDGDGDDVEDVEWRPTTPLKRPKQVKSSNQTTSRPGPASKKRPKQSVSDIIQAIERDEFMGYELLQIVKAAIPKL